MTPDRWARIKAVFQDALDLPRDERQALLDRECSEDPELRAEVESLLSAEASSEEFLDGQASDLVPEALTERDPPDANNGRQIGPYRIVREIGAGGMGMVYLAERTDEFKQTVALKLMHRGMDSRAVVSRFRHERQILAGLDHPNIAKLLDGGATDDGRPYFVMEYVEGVPLDTWLSERAPDVPTRIRLFLSVCSAVQYAHQNLVVHRDLKPGNILVTGDGTPKLLDFGIAKLLRRDDTMGTALTQVGMRLMTPQYASPEQARGLPVATSTDVYSLGVILYELLAGKAPYEFAGDSPVEFERVIVSQEPQRPSAVASRDLSRQLVGDLDIIVMKALEKEPAQRYASVEQFAGDLRRHLDGIPIVARPQTWRYRSGRFVRRNRIPVFGSALVVLSLAGGLIATAWQARIAREQRARAERNFNDVRHLAQSFLFDFHDQIKDLPGSTNARNLVVQTASDYLRRLEQEARSGSGSTNDALAREVAESYLRLGEVQGNPYGSNRGDTAAAMESYRQAASIADGLLKRNANEPLARLYSARAHRAIGEVLPQQGEAAAGAEQVRAAVAALEGTALENDAKTELARDYEALGDVLGHSGYVNLSDPAGARKAYEKSLELNQALKRQRGVALIRMKLGDLDADGGDLKTALSRYRESAVDLEALSAAEPQSVPARRAVAMIHGKTASAYETLGMKDEAQKEYAKASGISKQLLDADPHNDQARMDYSVNLKNRADFLSKNHNDAAALPLYQEVLGILGPMSAAHPGNLLLRSRYAEMLVNVGELLAGRHQEAEARRTYGEGLRIVKELADRKEATAEDLNDYVEDLLDAPMDDLANPAQAAAYGERAVALSKGAVPQYLDRLALALSRLGRNGEAADAESKALAGVPASSPDHKVFEERLDKYRKSK